MKTSCIITIMLLCCSVAIAKETFFSALESQAEVEKEGGTVDGGSFVPGKFGNGFVSENAGDVIHFPVEDRFVNLEEGTVELWVTMGMDIATVTGELFLFMTYKRGTDAIFLQFDNGGKARMRVKSANSWVNADSGALNWKKGEHHHMAGTWGPDGLKLYLDGEMAGENASNKGPTVFAETFEINNASPPDPKFPTNCVVDGIRISDHQKDVDELVLDDPAPVQPQGKLAITWGQLKTVK
ncbi:MAG: hypothetical protein OXD54_09720 [Candidatus Poribacteria bacterium]|nr:hypothetical protein [Candidatus Poribacteria bacterium]